MSTTQIVPVREIAVAVSDASSATAVMPSTSGTQWNNIVKDKAVTKQMPGSFLFTDFNEKTCLTNLKKNAGKFFQNTN